MNFLLNSRSTCAGVSVVILTLLFGSARAAEPSLADAEKLGAEIAAELRSARPGGSSTNTGTLKLRDARGRRREVPVTVVTLLNGEEWSISYQARLTNGATETLTARYRASGTPVYELATTAPGAAMAAAPRTLRPAETAVPFAGTDFWVCDLGLEFLHWPTQRYIKNELSNGRLCQVLESVNPGTNGYAKVWSYIDEEFKGLLSAKAFNARGFAVKDFSTGSFTKVNDRWFLKDIRIRDEKADTRTELQYSIPGN